MAGVQSASQLPLPAALVAMVAAVPTAEPVGPCCRVNLEVCLATLPITRLIFPSISLEEPVATDHLPGAMVRLKM